MTPEFWRKRRVLLTGHTGFKGAWASAMLSALGAQVFGLSLAPESDPNLWAGFGGRLGIDEATIDLRDAAAVREACLRAKPQIVLHMAAQAQVRQGYLDPLGTFDTNAMGTANLLDALRDLPDVETILVVTSDKVYRNEGKGEAFGEARPLGGSDPYSASKVAAEAVVQAYADSYFTPKSVPLATARGGNVVGGGDFSSDRLIPDIFRAVNARKAVELRYPKARRPWQHVLDCLSGYFLYIEHLDRHRSGEPRSLNFGPAPGSDLTVAEIAEAMARHLGSNQHWQPAAGSAPPEKQTLMLDNSLAKATLGWSPKLDIDDTIAWTAEWYAAFAKGAQPLELVQTQIERHRAR